MIMKVLMVVRENVVSKKRWLNHFTLFVVFLSLLLKELVKRSSEHLALRNECS